VQGGRQGFSRYSADDWAYHIAQYERDVAAQDDGLQFDVDASIALFVAGDAVGSPDQAGAFVLGELVLVFGAVAGDFLDAGGFGDAVPALAASKDIGYMHIRRPEVDVERGLCDQGFVHEQHVELVVIGEGGGEGGCSGVCGGGFGRHGAGFGGYGFGIDYSGFVDRFVTVVIADYGQKVVDGRVGNEGLAIPIVNQSGGNVFGNVLAGG
jgi:hypothetical protein